MSSWDRDRGSTARQHRSRPAPARSPDGVALALQHTVGNRGIGQVLARKGAKNAGQFEKSVTVGGLGPLEIKETNVDSWVAKKDGPDELVFTTASGKHSEKLSRMADGRTRVDGLEVHVVVGQNTQVTVVFDHVVIKGYEKSGETEQWKASGFEHVDIKRVSIGAARP